MTQLTTKSSVVRQVRRISPKGIIHPASAAGIGSSLSSSPSSPTTPTTPTTTTTTTTTTNKGPIWEWEDDEGGYAPFDADFQPTLEQAFNSAKKKLEKVKLRNSFYNFDFVSMTQTNIGSGFVRNIKRSAPPGKWQFKENEQSNWTDYDNISNRLIEATFSRGAAKVILNHAKYCNSKGGFEIDFSSLFEIEKCSGNSKQVQRIPAPSSHSIYGKTAG